MKRNKILFSSATIVVALALSTFFIYIPYYQDSMRNAVSSQPVIINKNVRTFHNTLFVADMHADSLLWNRNLKKQHDYGHIDLPRMVEGNISLQIFSVVTKTPHGLNLFQNSNETDNVTLLAIAQRWPIKTWNSLLERALYQAQKLHDLQNNSTIPFYIIKDTDDFFEYLLERESNNKITAGLLSLEGAHALEGKLENIDRLFNAGFRIIGFTHFFDNQLGGSAHGIDKGGITEFGIDALKRMEELGIFVDISHASPKLVEDIFKYSTRPILATHTGVKAICGNSPRNLTDQQIMQIANSGGLIGIGFWPNAVCTNDTKGIVDSIQYVLNLVGEDYVALGSDFDGNVQTPFDGAHIQALTQALLDANFTNIQIEKIMGANIRHIFLEYLPSIN